MKLLQSHTHKSTVGHNFVQFADPAEVCAREGWGWGGAAGATGTAFEVLSGNASLYDTKDIVHMWAQYMI